MDDDVARFSTRFGGNLLTCGRCSLVSETQNEIVVSWITLWGVMKVYWLDLTLAYIFDHAVCCASAASSGRSLHLITSQLRMNCPNHIRRTKSSIKKRIIVRRSVRSMFGEQTFAQLRTGFTRALPLGQTGSHLFLLGQHLWFIYTVWSHCDFAPGN